MEWDRYSCSRKLVVQLLSPCHHKSVKLVLVCSFFQNLAFKTDKIAPVFNLPPGFKFMPQIELLLSFTVSFLYVFYCQETRLELLLVPSFVEVGRDLCVPSLCECKLRPTSYDSFEGRYQFYNLHVLNFRLL